MRNLKKHLSVLLVVAMIFTMMAPVFAASSNNYEDEALALYGLGLFKGTSDISYVPNLEGTLTREQAAIMLLRLFGQEEEAQAMSNGEANVILTRFQDAGLISDWAAKQVAYATAHGIINGIPTEDGLIFNPQGNLKGIQFASMVLQELGVKDFKYEYALESLVGTGAITVPQMIAFDQEQLTRDDVVGISFGTLTATSENGNTVIENLIEKGTVEREYAEKLGLVEPIVIEEPVIEEPVVEEPVVEEPVIEEPVVEEPVIEEPVIEEPVVEEPVVEEPVLQEAKIEFKATEAQSIAQGQTLFEVGKVVIAAGAEDVTVTGLKLSRAGLSSDSDIKSITVWNGTEKVNSIGIFSNSAANIAFTKLVNVKAGETLELSIKMNVAAAANIGAEVKLSLTEVKADASFEGTFPMEGNKFVIAPANLGRINVVLAGDCPTANINAGDTDVRLTKFNITFVNEAQTLKQFILTQDGTVSDADLANLRLIDDNGEVLATGEMKNGELCFLCDKEYSSGDTARLTVRGDILGGAGRTVKLTVNNVNDIQSVGRTYGTTIAAAALPVAPADGTELTIEKGTLVISKDTSSPATATLATKVDDQLMTTLKIEAVGEPVQLETINVEMDGTNLSKVKEIKLVKDNLVVASQECKLGVVTNTTLSLPLSEVIEVAPGAPVKIDILMDADGAAVTNFFQLGFNGMNGTGLISGKDVKNTDKTMGSRMEVGDVKVTVEQKAQVDGYVFRNQAAEKLATFEIHHNLGETVKLSAVTLKICDGTYNPNSAAALNDVTGTFKNVKFVSEAGADMSETIVSPSAAELRISLKENVTVKAGETLKLVLMSDIKSNARQNAKYDFFVTGATAVTTKTGAAVAIDPIAASRCLTISVPATDTNITTAYSKEGDLKSGNVLREQKGAILGQWTVSNSAAEDVRIDKAYVTAAFGQSKADTVVNGTEKAALNADLYSFELNGTIVPVEGLGIEVVANAEGTPIEESVVVGEEPAVACYIRATDGKYVKKADGTVADPDDTIDHRMYTAKLPGLKTSYVENYTLKDGTGKTLATFSNLQDGKVKEVTFSTPMVIEAKADSANGENELILMADIVKGAQYGGQISVALGNNEVGAPATDKVFEVTGAVSGERFFVNAAPMEAGDGNAVLTKTVAITKITPKALNITTDPQAGVAGQEVAAFELINGGEAKAKITTIKVNVVSNTSKTATGDGSGAIVDHLLLKDTDGKVLAESDIFEAENPTVKVTANGAGVATFELKENAVSIAKAESKSFEITIPDEARFDVGEGMRITLNKEGIIYDDANGNGYEITADDDLTLPTVTAKS